MNLAKELQRLDYLRELSKALNDRQMYCKEFNQLADRINTIDCCIVFENGKHNYRRMTTEEKAIGYAEKYGIVEYHISNGKMVYYESFSYEHATYKSIVDLETMEETRTRLKGYYKPYKSRVGGKYQANWC